MILNLAKLCQISSEHKFLSFLYELDRDIFVDYKMKLVKSTGCKYNQRLMESLISVLDKLGRISELESFISNSFPDCISANEGIFIDYNPNILTIPHRRILNADHDMKSFSEATLITKYLSFKDKIYVEYLNKDEQPYFNKVKWILDNYSGSIIISQI